jgi:hypothetical protein
MAFNLMKKINSLCAPAYIYLVISAVTLLIMVLQNAGNTHSYCAGNIQCNNTNTILIFIIKVIYVVFWTWLLDLICEAGWTPISWLILLIPFLLMFLILGTFLLNSSGNVGLMTYSTSM